jgi:Na+/melibiose symporter-like transporter
VIPSAGIPLAILANLGYVPNVEQSETIRFTISAIYGLAPALFGVLSLLIFLFFPITEKTHAQVLEGIEAHKRGEPAVDPLTGKLVQPPDDRGVDEETGWFLDHFASRELRRASRMGPGVIVLGASVWATLSLAISVVCVLLVIPTLPEISTAPRWWTVVLIAVAGVALAFCLYHVIRVVAARRMQKSPIANDVVASHIELSRSISRTGASQAI